jgi:hypothetical protein
VDEQESSEPPVTVGFEVRLTGVHLRPINIQGMHSHDLVHDLKMRLQSQEGIPLLMQRVFLAGIELKDDMSAGGMVCTREHAHTYGKQNIL